jgi:hypothetical protein
MFGWNNAFAATAAVALLVTGGCSASPLPAAPPAGAGDTARAPGAAAPLQYATYEWSDADLTQRRHAGTLWTFLSAKHVNDVLDGFTSKDIARCSTAKGAAQENAMIASFAAHGVRVELLLGDPSWIVPSGYKSLTGILRALRAVKFAGLDLDLEPNEVSGVPPATALADLAAAMRVYVRASTWPVSIDVNHIYADAAATKQYGYCLMCGLQRDGVKHVNLMTYVSDPKTVVADVAPILAAYPSIEFTISQSVESTKVLPVWDSYWHDGFATFYADMQTLDATLRPRPNYGGLLIESMYYLERIKP